jgi:hypothetical protein
VSDYTFIRDANAWAAYKAMIDGGKEDSTFGRAYAYQHNGWPPEYPCLVRSRFWDDPNGPYNYDHSFMTLADVDALRAKFP